MSGAGNFEAALKAAYPKMSDEELNKKINKGKTENISLKSTLIRIVLTIIIFIIMIGAFFTLPHIWIMFNGGWF